MNPTRKVVLLILVSAVCASAPAMIYDDLNPAPFRGQDETTFQVWQFRSNVNPVAADIADNVNGPAVAVVTGDSPLWMAQDGTHMGVWVVDHLQDSEMIIDVPNFPEASPGKEIWVQILFSSADDSAPELYVVPEADISRYESMVLEQVVQGDDGYSHATYSIQIGPSPTFEQIYIRPRFCDVKIDALIVETQVIPEPATFALLGLGAFLCFKTRK